MHCSIIDTSSTFEGSCRKSFKGEDWIRHQLFYIRGFVKYLHMEALKSNFIASLEYKEFQYLVICNTSM